MEPVTSEGGISRGPVDSLLQPSLIVMTQLTESDPENHVPEQTIRNRAHEIYNERGGETGHDVEAATRAV